MISSNFMFSWLNIQQAFIWLALYATITYSTKHRQSIYISIQPENPKHTLMKFRKQQIKMSRIFPSHWLQVTFSILPFFHNDLQDLIERKDHKDSPKGLRKQASKKGNQFWKLLPSFKWWHLGLAPWGVTHKTLDQVCKPWRLGFDFQPCWSLGCQTWCLGHPWLGSLLAFKN